MNTSILESELTPLNTQIEQTRQKREALEGELHIIEAELDTFSEDRQRIGALQEVCDALEKLGELKADDLFWEGIPGANERAAGHVERLRGRVARFEEEISGILEKQSSYQEQTNRCLQEMHFLEEEVYDAYEREEQRKEEFVVEREIAPIQNRSAIMPWTREAESENRLRRAVLVALLVCFVFGTVIPLIKVPLPDRSATVAEIPKRLVKLVKKELPKPKSVRKPVVKQDQVEPKQQTEKPEPAPDKKKPDKLAKKGSPSKKKSKLASNSGGDASAARKKAERVGVLKFKNVFADMMNEAPVAKIGTDARLSNLSPRVKGQAVARRSLVAIQGQGSTSGGISNAGLSRNVGNGNVDRLGGGTGDGEGGGGSGFVRVESAIANLEESSRPVSDGLAPGRTDEEIQIVFDRYKATLYRIYNKELRKDPTLRGKILLRISIETSGAVSMCKVESTDLGSPNLVAKIVQRIERFNFGPKEGVMKMTILYPIDFLPAG